MRIDKFLKNSRIIKRRTVAKEACMQGRVFINDKVAKPGDLVKPGDIVTVNFGSNSIKVRVLSIEDNVKKDGAAGLYEYIE
ncbi:MAG TPA: RNA-binding S4 domain-containing protein [Tissierellia bacterium]|nr:RNA-binding S4 domain-containing protein [Tissierellia bacterium]